MRKMISKLFLRHLDFAHTQIHTHTHTETEHFDWLRSNWSKIDVETG